MSLLVSLIPLGLILFCRNSLIAPYEFTMEKVLFVVRSLKEKLVINLESLLLHGNEDFREKILKREEKRRKSQNKVHMARKGNPISGGMFNVLFRISIVVLFPFSVFAVYFLSLVLGFDLSLIWVKLKSMLLQRSLRLLFSHLVGWEVPVFVLCIVGSVVGSCFHMQGSESASAAGAPSEPSESSEGWTSLLESTAQQPSVVPSGGSPAGGWTRFEEDVLLEESAGHSNSNPSVNQPQPGEQAMPPVNPLASGEAEAGPAHVFPYDEEEVIGGDSVLSIQSRLLSKYDFPSAEQIESARKEARNRFRMKVDIIRVMTPLHPEGNWEGQGARALDNARTKTGEQPFGILRQMRDSLSSEGIQSRFFLDLRDKVFWKRENSDDESQA